MKTKAILLSFVLLVNKVGLTQTKNMTKVHDKADQHFFLNEYWSFTDLPGGCVNFENFYFAKDGTFIHTYGYSGGIYYAYHNKGVYRYNAAKKEILLHVTEHDEGKKGAIKGTTKPTPKKIVVTEINDTSVTAILGAESSHTLNMVRTVGTTTDQYWYKGPNSSHDALDFTLSGQITIVQENDSRREYKGNYHISEEFLYLEINSMAIGERNDEKQTKLFTPSIKTFLKLHIDNKTVAIEKVNLNDIIDGKRNWEFKGTKFHIVSIASANNVAEWDEYNRVP